MATDASVVPAPSRPLPPLGAYLRAVESLGKRSIRPALPALVFLWFYRFGMDVYLDLAGGGTSPLGFPDERARVVHLFMTVSAYLPLVVLIYMPFLPLQDALLHGERRSFLQGIRRVLERFAPFMLSALAQGMILLLPVAVVFGILVAAVAPIPAIPHPIAAVITVALLLPTLVWILLAAFFLTFAMPALILDGLGPIGSIRASVRLVARNFWGLVGRFLAWFILLFVLVVIATLPAVALRGGSAFAGPAAAALRITGTLWASAVTALTFPFWVAALLVLYRALVPREGEERLDEAVAVGPVVPAPATPRPLTTDQPTPYIFE